MEQYYLNQAGHGIPLSAFEGGKFQRGHGFFGRLISRAILPMLRYLGKKLYSTDANIYENVKEGKEFGESLKNRGLDSLKEIADEGIEKLRQGGN